MDQLPPLLAARADNSDPTSGNALEQIPKIVMTLSAGALLAEEPGRASAADRRGRRLLAAALGRARLAPLRAQPAARATRAGAARRAQAGRSRAAST